jgi:predicted anti-sigma-YlaC factor YlaD
MRAAHCDRARFWISLHLDGVLSEFETAMLDQHVGRCSECHAFKLEAAGNTFALRAASLERVTVPVALPARPKPVRQAVAGLGTIAAAVAAAVVSLHFVSGSHTSPDAARLQSGSVARPAGLAVLVIDGKSLGVRQEGQSRVVVPNPSVVRGTYGLPA